MHYMRAQNESLVKWSGARGNIAITAL